MKTSFIIEKDSDGYPVSLDCSIKDMAKYVDRGEWNENNHEQFINYFRDNIIRDEEKMKWLKETNNNRTEKYDKELKYKEFRSAVNDMIFMKDLTEEYILNKIDEFRNNGHPEGTIEKLLIFKNIVNIEDNEIKKNKLNNYIEKYL